MTTLAEGPLLDRLTHRLSECPADFLRDPAMGRRSGVRVSAVVHDLLQSLGGPILPAQRLKPFAGAEAAQLRWLRLVLVGGWLLGDEWFIERGGLSAAAEEWLAAGLQPLAGVAAAELFVTDPDRREELARRCLAALKLRPAGETPAQAEDRLKSLDSVARARVVEETRQAEERAKRLREEMRRKEATEAAAKASREW